MTIINAGTLELSNLKVYAAKELVWEGSIKAGEEETLYFYPDRDGSFDIKYMLKEKNISYKKLGYTTNNDWSKFVVTITQDKLEFEQVFDEE